MEALGQQNITAAALGGRCSIVATYPLKDANVGIGFSSPLNKSTAYAAPSPPNGHGPIPCRVAVAVDPIEEARLHGPALGDDTIVILSLTASGHATPCRQYLRG